MKLILMRHGQAEGYGQRADNERRLTEYGQQQAQETAAYLTSNYQPDTLIVSPYIRAKQTMSACHQQLSLVTGSDLEVYIYDHITPADDAKQALLALSDLASEYQAQCMLVVCHMSIVAKLAGLLIGDTPEAFALAEARVFETEFIAMDMGKEVDRFVPQQY